MGFLTFFTFLFHSSFATCTFTVFLASPAETTIPLISLESTPDVDFVTVFDAAATAGATALADIAGCRPPMVISPYRRISRSGLLGYAPRRCRSGKTAVVRQGCFFLLVDWRAVMSRGCGCIQNSTALRRLGTGADPDPQLAGGHVQHLLGGGLPESSYLGQGSPLISLRNLKM